MNRTDKQRKEADERFFKLRNSGYKGPIDQDGHKTTDIEIQTWLFNARHGKGKQT